MARTLEGRGGQEGRRKEGQGGDGGVREGWRNGWRGGRGVGQGERGVEDGNDYGGGGDIRRIRKENWEARKKGGGHGGEKRREKIDEAGERTDLRSAAL